MHAGMSRCLENQYSTDQVHHIIFGEANVGEEDGGFVHRVVRAWQIHGAGGSAVKSTCFRAVLSSAKLHIHP